MITPARYMAPVVLTFVIIVTICSLAGPEATATGPDREMATKWIGITLPSEKVLRGCQQSGLLAEVLVREGMPVSPGQPLFKLDSQTLELETARLKLQAESTAELDQARENRRYLQDEELRLQKLVKKGMASESELREISHRAALAKVQVGLADMQKKAAQLRWQEAEARLAQRTVLSPINGVVTRIIHQQGEVIDQLEPVLEIINLTPLWVELDCPVKDSAHFQPGQMMAVGCSRKTRGETGQTRFGRVIFASMSADPASHTFRVRLALENRKNPWKAGLKVWIKTPPPNPSTPPK